MQAVFFSKIQLNPSVDVKQAYAYGRRGGRAVQRQQDLLKSFGADIAIVMNTEQKPAFFFPAGNINLNGLILAYPMSSGIFNNRLQDKPGNQKFSAGIRNMTAKSAGVPIAPAHDLDIILKIINLITHLP